QFVRVSLHVALPICGAVGGLFDQFGGWRHSPAVEVGAQFEPVGASGRGDLEPGKVLDGDLHGDAHGASSAVVGVLPARAVRTVRRGPGSGRWSLRSLRSPLART